MALSLDKMTVRLWAITREHNLDYETELVDVKMTLADAVSTLPPSVSWHLEFTASGDLRKLSTQSEYYQYEIQCYSVHLDVDYVRS